VKNPSFCNASDEYYSQARDYLIQLVPDNSEIALDLGCGAGALGKKLLELGKAKTVYGVEIFEAAAEEARKFYNKVIIGDIESIHLEYTSTFDVVICADILEHLKDPGNVLQRIHAWLKDDGILICCIPNVR
jgi:2-polyprenyl-3-methyl-5-hydroxy-6-metoxy-1,4-benzoquinol methylase